jgi:hypothetical protein
MDILAIAQLGGFAFAAVVAVVGLKLVFDAWRRGDLVSKPVYDASLAREAALRVELAEQAKANAASAAEIKRVADLAERILTTTSANGGELRRLGEVLDRWLVTGRTMRDEGRSSKAPGSARGSTEG